MTLTFVLSFQDDAEEGDHDRNLWGQIFVILIGIDGIDLRHQYR